MVSIFVFLLHSISALELELRGNTTVCMTALENIINKGIIGPFDNNTSERDFEMALYSGLGANDLGNYEGC